jgi:hypothetical protein
MVSERLSDIFAALSQDPELLEALSLSNLVHFIVYATALKSDILLTQSARHDPDVAPEFLSPVIQNFLSKVINAGLETTFRCWSVFKELIWSSVLAEELTRNPEENFRAFGYSSGLSE